MYHRLMLGLYYDILERDSNTKGTHIEYISAYYLRLDRGENLLLDFARPLSRSHHDRHGMILSSLSYGY